VIATGRRARVDARAGLPRQPLRLPVLATSATSACPGDAHDQHRRRFRAYGTRRSAWSRGRRSSPPGCWVRSPRTPSAPATRSRARSRPTASAWCSTSTARRPRRRSRAASRASRRSATASPRTPGGGYGRSSYAEPRVMSSRRLGGPWVPAQPRVGGGERLGIITPNSSKARSWWGPVASVGGAGAVRASARSLRARSA
jgi:hypothetical protein